MLGVIKKGEVSGHVLTDVNCCELIDVSSHIRSSAFSLIRNNYFNYFLSEFSSTHQL